MTSAADDARRLGWKGFILMAIAVFLVTVFALWVAEDWRNALNWFPNGHPSQYATGEIHLGQDGNDFLGLVVGGVLMFWWVIRQLHNSRKRYLESLMSKPREPEVEVEITLG